MTDDMETKRHSLGTVLGHLCAAEHILSCSGGFLDDVPEEVGESVCAAVDAIGNAIAYAQKAYKQSRKLKLRIRSGDRP